MTRRFVRLNAPKFTIDVSNDGEHGRISISGSGDNVYTLTDEERLEVLGILDTGKMLRKLMDERDEAKRERRKAEVAAAHREGQLNYMRKVLRLFRDFVIHGASVWKMGANHHHPMWEMVSVALGDDNHLHPTQKEWTFIYPDNKKQLDDLKD
jgi:hypothetical protein